MRTCIKLACVGLTAALSGCGILGGNTGGADGGLDSGGPDGGADGGIQARFSSLYADYFQECRGCHAPNAPGRTAETEKTLDFTNARTAYTTLTTGKATGLVGNQQACNGVAFVVAGRPADSLVVAVLDETVRRGFRVMTAPRCDGDAISDMTVKVGRPPSAAFLTALKQWIQAGAADN
ncbi:MAG: hypothetical protein RMK29_01290 [Myxococcales bacterium]|nr:hypothetical protein [Myxococcota bacterium]MDW8280312.1 hypothetical protein [Myxococcales bacterium]